MSIALSIILIVVVGLIAAVAAFFFGSNYRKNKSESVIGSAEAEAKRIINDAIKTADSKKKEAIIEGKDALLAERAEAEKEIKERRKDVQQQEKRILQKEENLDKKLDNLDKKEANIEKKEASVSKKLEEADNLIDEQTKTLEKISGLSSSQAKEQLLKKLDDDLTHEKAVKIINYEQELKDDADKKAKEIISAAIQRCAADHVSEAAISVVEINNDDMKGRLIGREGRNIRAIESVTGVDLIIDDTPEVITISCFEPVRREIARITVEKLLVDGRIHPAKIEECFAKAQKEVDATIKQEGERAVIKAGVTAIHPELVKTLGRLRYRTSYGQNVLNHSLEVAYLSGLMACELGIDPTIARRAGLIHDIGKALDHEMEGSHIEIGTNLAKKCKENSTIVNAIEAHHGDVEPQTVVAFIVQAADAISAARPGSRRESLEKYLQRLEKLESLASGFKGVEGCYAIQAGREIRVLVKPEVINDDKMTILARDISKKIEQELSYPGQIKVNIIRESRAIEYAK